MNREGGAVVPFPSHRPSRTRALSRVLVVFTVMLAIVGIVHFSSLFALEEIRVLGNNRLSQEDIHHLAAIELGSNVLYLNTGKLEHWLSTSPWVKEVTVSRELPKGLVIEVVERQPLFLAPYYTSFLVVANDGVLLGSIPSDLETGPLPIITGLTVPDPAVPGTPLADLELDKLHQLLSGLPEDFWTQIVEIHQDAAGEWALFTTEGVEILFGQAQEFAVKLELIAVALEQAPGPIATINVRNGERAHITIRQ